MKRFLSSNKTEQGSKQSSDSASTSVKSDAEAAEGSRKPKYRKYDDKYLDFGFSCIEINNEERPQCVVCMKVLSVESMLPSKLKRHLETVHSNLIGKPREFFKRKETEAVKQKASFSKHSKVNSNALLASFKVAYHIAKCKKPHTIAEELILPAAVDMAKIMIGEDAGKQLLKIPLSNNTISRRIDDISEDINNQLINSLRGKEFGIQLDEATDSHKDAHLICYVRYVNENQLIEDLLFCKEIEGGTSGKELFDIVNNFMAENDINWEDCVGVCTDGGRSMSGRYIGLQSRIREKAPNAVWTHCIIHREALAAAKFSSELSAVIKTVIQVINFIKTRPMKARFFSKLCDDTGAQHSSLLYYSSARWLSLGNSLLRLFELRQEIHIFLSEDNNALADMFIDESFLLKLAFLTDIFERLNILNKSLQGNETDIFQLTSKVEAFKKKLMLWEKSLKNGDCSMFSTLNQFLKENDLTLKEEMKTMLTQHLSRVQSYFEDYLPKDEIKAQQWVNDPFQTEMPENFSNEEAEQLIDISTDLSLKSKFQSQSLFEFWNGIDNEFPLLSKKALRAVIPFASSYLCECGFSAVAVIKSKYRAKLNIEKEIRVAISKFTPRYNELIKDKQAHPSH